jgi:hypothetical protein
MAAGMLEQHYRRESKPAEVQRIVRTYGQAFESAAALESPTLVRRCARPSKRVLPGMEEAIAASRRLAWLSLGASVVAFMAAVCTIFVHVMH